MSKEYLEAYFKIDNTLCLNSQNIKFGIDEDEHMDCQNIDEVVNCLETIKEALERLESIDNANPSEALECLKSLDIQVRFIGVLDVPSWEKYLPIIKQALIKAEKEHNSVNLLMQELDCKDFADLRKYARCGYEKLKSKEIS